MPRGSRSSGRKGKSAPPAQEAKAQAPSVGPGHLDSGPKTTAGDGNQSAGLSSGQQANNHAFVQPPQEQIVSVQTSIAVVMFMYMLSFCLLVPVFPKVLKELSDGDTAQAASYYGLLMGVRNLLEFFSSPSLGMVSDSFGRKSMLVFSFAVAAVEYFAMATAPSLGTAFLTRVLSGMLDGAMPISYALLTDVSRIQNVSAAVNYGIVGVVFGVAFIIGPSIGAALMTTSMYFPFAVSGLLVSFAAALTVALVPETVKNRKDFDWEQANPIPLLSEFFSNAMLARVTIPFILGYLPTGTYYIWYLYLEYRYGWHHLVIGAFLSFMGAQIVIIQGPVLRRLVPEQLGEEAAVLVGLACNAIAFLLYGWTPYSGLLFFISLGACLGALYEPAMRAVIVKVAGDDVTEWQGVLQGAVASIRTLTMACAAPLFGSLFAYSISPECEEDWGVIMPGLPFYVGCLFYVAAYVTARPIMRTIEESESLMPRPAAPHMSDSQQGVRGQGAPPVFGSKYLELKERRRQRERAHRNFHEDDEEQMEGLLNQRETADDVEGYSHLPPAGPPPAGQSSAATALLPNMR